MTAAVKKTLANAISTLKQLNMSKQLLGLLNECILYLILHWCLKKSQIVTYYSKNLLNTLEIHIQLSYSSRHKNYQAVNIETIITSIYKMREIFTYLPRLVTFSSLFLN